MRTLVLNNQFLPMSIFPLYTVPAEDAIVRYLNGKCEVIHWYDRKIQTPSRDDLYWPSVIVYWNARSFKKEVRLKKESLFYRDHCKCVYCGTTLTIHGDSGNGLTYDHLHPQSKGGETTWNNVVAACRDCNEAKDNKTSGWVPSHEPYTPSFYDLLEIRKKYPLVVDHEAWIEFLPNWTGDVIVKNGLQKHTNVIYSSGDKVN